MQMFDRQWVFVILGCLFVVLAVKAYLDASKTAKQGYKSAGVLIAFIGTLALFLGTGCMVWAWAF